MDELADRAMEELVRGAPRLHQVVVDLAERHRLLDRVRRLLVTPGAPLDQQDALGARMQLAYACQELRPGFAERAQQPLVCKDHRHLVARGPHPAQAGFGLRGRRLAVDAVVGAIATPQLSRDPSQRVGIVVHREQDGPRVSLGL
jgi:hypothetical protein